MIQRSLRIVFMGTPAFAVPTLQYILDAGYPVVAVVTAPDKPGGRGMKQMLSSPIKQFAIEKGLPVLQPTHLKSKSFLAALKAFGADVQVVVAFRMLPEVLWNMPPGGTINLHGSLLPAYRGAAPIQWAIVRGEHTTGLTTFMLQHQIDTGKILLQLPVPILEDDDAGTLHDRMMYAGAGLMIATLDLMVLGRLTPVDQDESQASHAPKIFIEDARIEWGKPAKAIHNLIRGMSPYPGAWTHLDGQELKIWKSRLAATQTQGVPGGLRIENKKLLANTADGEIELIEVQLSGKKKMASRDFLNGYVINSWLLT